MKDISIYAHVITPSNFHIREQYCKSEIFGRRLNG